jgi:hypothetical protein
MINQYTCWHDQEQETIQFRWGITFSVFRCTKCGVIFYTIMTHDSITTLYGCSNLVAAHGTMHYSKHPLFHYVAD